MTYKEFERTMDNLRDLQTKLRAIDGDAGKDWMENFNALVPHVDKSMYPGCKWIDWYINDNNWGENELEACFETDMAPVRNYADLWYLIKNDQAFREVA